MKTYDRAQVLHVAAQMAAAILVQPDVEPVSVSYVVGMAKELIDEVERQCPPPGKPEATIAPGKRRPCP